jgi:hypothetical protein
MPKQPAIEQSTILMKHQLGTIDLSDIDELEKMRLSDAEVMDRAGDAEIFYKNHFGKVIKLLMNEQMKFIVENANNTDVLAFGRGSFNGLKIVEEWFQDQIRKSLSRFDKPEEG